MRVREREILLKYFNERREKFEIEKGVFKRIHELQYSVSLLGIVAVCKNMSNNIRPDVSVILTHLENNTLYFG